MFTLFRARYFCLWFAWSLTRISHFPRRRLLYALGAGGPSGYRQLCFLPQNTAPSALADQKIIGAPPKADLRHAGSNCMFADHVVLNQPLCGCRHRRIKIKTDCGCSKSQSGQVDFYQPPKWFNAAPKRIIQITYPHQRLPDRA